MLENDDEIIENVDEYGLEKATKNYTRKRAMIETMIQTLGVVTPACELCKVDRSTHYRWLKEDPTYKMAYEDLGEVALDFAETNLHKQIKEGVPASTIFYLKTKGKNRGYIEKTEIDWKQIPLVTSPDAADSVDDIVNPDQKPAPEDITENPMEQGCLCGSGKHECGKDQDKPF